MACLSPSWAVPVAVARIGLTSATTAGASLPLYPRDAPAVCQPADRVHLTGRAAV